MNEKNYKKRLDFQQKMMTRYLEQIEALKVENEKLKKELKEKDEVINFVTQLRKELTENVNDVKKYKKEYKRLIQELKKMKEIVTQEVYKSSWRWKLIKFLLK